MESRQTPRKLWQLCCGVLLAAALVALAACSSQQSSSSTAVAEKPSATSDTPMLVVPNVVSLTQADAEKSIVASGFKMGQVSSEASDTVPRGNVVSQSPQALATDVKDKIVSIVVSTGKAKPKKVSVPDVTGNNQADAEKKLADAGLIGVCAGSEESTEAEPGLVFKQSVDAGKKVKEGTKVSFTVALAPTPGTVTVPDLTGLTEKEAANKLDAADLGFDKASAYSNSTPEGLAMYQSYAAGAEVQHGTTITVTFSLGPKQTGTITVPNVITYSWSEAERTMESAGLTVRFTGDPAGVVTDQDIDPGTPVNEGVLVTLTLSRPTQMIVVPNLIGLTVSEAERVTDTLGLSLDGGNYGVVIAQAPDPGVELEPGSTVSIKVEDQPDDKVVIVPNFIGMGPTEAEATAQNVGLSLDGDADGTIIDQAPAAGTALEVGDTVSVKTN